MDTGDDTRSDVGSASSGASDVGSEQRTLVDHPLPDGQQNLPPCADARLTAFHDAIISLLASHDETSDGPMVHFVERYQLKVDLIFMDLLNNGIESRNQTNRFMVNEWKERVEKLRVKLAVARDRLERTRKVHHSLNSQLEIWRKTFDTTVTQLARSLDKREKLGVKLRDALIDLNNISDVPLSESLQN